MGRSAPPGRPEVPAWARTRVQPGHPGHRDLSAAREPEQARAAGPMIQVDGPKMLEMRSALLTSYIDREAISSLLLSMDRHFTQLEAPGEDLSGNVMRVIT